MHVRDHLVIRELIGPLFERATQIVRRVFEASVANAVPVGKGLRDAVVPRDVAPVVLRHLHFEYPAERMLLEALRGREPFDSVGGPRMVYAGRKDREEAGLGLRKRIATEAHDGKV